MDRRKPRRSVCNTRLPACTLWGRPLQMIDCQNLFCEVDKYARIAHPDIVGHSKRTRIKQKFRPKSNYFSPWYPPKWELNDRIAKTLRHNKVDLAHPFSDYGDVSE